MHFFFVKEAKAFALDFYCIVHINRYQHQCPHIEAKDTHLLLVRCDRDRRCSAFNLEHGDGGRTQDARCLALELRDNAEVDSRDLTDTPGASFMQKICLRSM